MDALTPGPALFCETDLGGCGATSPVTEADAESETCPLCGGHAQPYKIEACPNEGNADCPSDDHDWGRGVHVTDLD